MRFRKGRPDHVPENSKYTSFAVRSEKWRLVGKGALYDIDNDPGEKKTSSKRTPKSSSRCWQPMAHGGVKSDL